MNNFDWSKSFLVDFDPATGLSQAAQSTKRRLSDMRNMYLQQDLLEQRLCSEDPLVYQFYELGAPEQPGELAFGTTILYPGTVGDEYFMTKGHFHTILDTSEVYYTLRGRGIMMMENPEGDCHWEELSPGRAVYVPRRYAHRMINVGDAPLVTFFVFEARAGHDYGSIETKGYRKLVVRRGGAPAVIDNPRWK